MSEINAIWEHIEAWYASQKAAHLLHPGASAEAIASAEKQLGVPLPLQLRQSLQRHDGTAEGGWRYGTLLGVESIQAEEKIWRELLDNGTFSANADHDASEGDASIQKGWWVRGWIPLDADGAGNGNVVDIVPGPNGVVGQIIDMDHEVGPSGPEFSSLAEYLEDVLKDLESGEFAYYDDGIYDIDDIDNGVDSDDVDDDQ